MLTKYIWLTMRNRQSHRHHQGIKADHVGVLLLGDGLVVVTCLYCTPGARFAKVDMKKCRVKTDAGYHLVPK